MPAVSRIARAQDPDAEYVLRQIETAERYNGRWRSASAVDIAKCEQARVNAGQRLAEVKARLAPGEKFSPGSKGKGLMSAFTAWYQDAGLRRSRVYYYLALARCTDTEREAMRKKTIKVSRKSYLRRRRRELRPITYSEAVGPLVLALNELNRQMYADPASAVVARLQKSYDQGEGLDIGFVTTLTEMRDWFDEVIEGATPLVVQCG
jgi:hypothetical protein